MSFSSFPNELVRQIIESTVPSTFHSTTNIERQATLRSLCLVNRRFLSIAQPMLFEIVWMDSFDKLDDILDKVEIKGWLDVIRDMVIEDPDDGRSRTGQMERLARAGLRMQNLRIDVSCWDALDCKVLQEFPNLKHLRFSGSTSLSSPSILPKLESFSLDYQALPTLTTMLNPALLPSLRQLALVLIDNDEEVAYFAESRLCDLVEQLDAIYVDGDLVTVAPTYLRAAFDRTLFECYTVRSGVVGIKQGARHLRILNLDGRSPLDVFDSLTPLAEAVASQEKPTLRSIYLDISLEPASTLPASAATSVADLLRACSEKGVEVCYEVQPKDSIGNVDPYFSEEFYRRQIEEKRKLMKKEAV